MNWLKGIFGGVIKAGAMALARHAATLAGGTILTWLLSHHVNSDFATRLVGDFQDIILTASGAGLLAAGIGTSLKDVGSVNGKMAVVAAAAVDMGRAQGLQQAMQQGATLQASADDAKIASVASAMKEADKATKTDKAALVAALKAGTF